MQPLLPREREFQWFKGNRGADFVALRIKLLCSSGSRLEHWHNWRTLKIACGDSFEVRADAAQFGSHKRIDKTRAPVEPGKQLVPDLVVNCKRDLRAVWPDLREVNDSHQANVPTRGFKRVLIGHVALERLDKASNESSQVRYCPLQQLRVILSGNDFASFFCALTQQILKRPKRIFSSFTHFSIVIVTL
jgi:hypothetical protein